MKHKCKHDDRIRELDALLEKAWDGPRDGNAFKGNPEFEALMVEQETLIKACLVEQGIL